VPSIELSISRVNEDDALRVAESDEIAPAWMFDRSQEEQINRMNVFSVIPFCKPRSHSFAHHGPNLVVLSWQWLMKSKVCFCP
jgi:hypothetical protein